MSKLRPNSNSRNLNFKEEAAIKGRGRNWKEDGDGHNVSGDEEGKTVELLPAAKLASLATIGLARIWNPTSFFACSCLQHMDIGLLEVLYAR